MCHYFFHVLHLYCKSILKYPSGLTEHIPSTGKEEFLPVLWTGNESIDLRTLNPGEYITGYYSISDFQQFIERN